MSYVTPSSRMKILLLFLLLILAILLLTSCSRVGRQSGNTSGTTSSTGTQSGSAARENHPSEHRTTPEVSITEVTPRENRGGDDASKADQSPGELTVELRQGKIGSGKVALTFDAGASSKPTSDLLKVLQENNVKATFFLTGKWVEENPELTREIISDGHEIGNHTYSHPDLRGLSDDQIREQLDKAEEIVQSVAGVTTKPYFRPPFGGRDSRVIRIAAEDGYQCVYWTLDCLDAFKKGITSGEIQTRVLDKTTDGSIILMHCGSWPTVKALPEIISSLRSQGYDLVRVSDLVAH